MQNFGAQPAEGSGALHPSLNKRRGARQKVHLPARAQVNGKLSLRPPEPGEVIDLSEDGACIQTSLPLKPESKLTLSLDLLETNAFVSTSGVVVWSDQRGRNGIHFQEISDDSREQLRSWLALRSTDMRDESAEKTFGQELAPRPVRSIRGPSDTKRISSKREYVTQSPEQTRAALQAEAESRDVDTPVPELSNTDLPDAGLRNPDAGLLNIDQPAAFDQSMMLSTLVEVKREVEGIRDLDVALGILAERSLALTHATGSAVALARYKAADEMICRARAGSDAPGLGAKLQVGSGFSGECVRTGRALRCDDSESDPRVDREGCRMLGIRSMIAIPIRRDDAVVGILEVFSPSADAFGPAEEKILQRLSEMAAGCMDRHGREVTPGVRTGWIGSSQIVADEIATQAQVAEAPPFEAPPAAMPRFHSLESPLHLEEMLERDSSSLRKPVLFIAGAGILAGLVWFVLAGGTSKANLTTKSAGTLQSQSSTAVSPGSSKATDFQSLQKLATNGDPDAQFDMGARYATGEDVKQDYAESVRWFTEAAEQGHVIAQATLGAYYWAGRGIPQDLSKAYFWSAIAEAGGDTASKYRIEVLASRMPHSQVAAAEQQANLWLKKHQLSSKTPR